MIYSGMVIFQLANMNSVTMKTLTYTVKSNLYNQMQTLAYTVKSNLSNQMQTLAYTVKSNLHMKLVTSQFVM